MNGRRRTLWIVAMLVAGTTPALAATNCSVSTSGVAFGTYDPTVTTPDDSTGTLNVTCTRQILVDPFEIDFQISLSRGSSNNYANRQMFLGTQRLRYNLYTNAAYSIVWGDGTGQTQTVSGDLDYNWFQTSNSRSYTMYGRMPAQQSASPGTYSDSIVVTIEF